MRILFSHCLLSLVLVRGGTPNYIPLFELRKKNQKILFLVAKVTPEGRFTSKFVLQIANVDNEPFTFFVMLQLQSRYLLIATKRGQLRSA